MTIRRKSCRSRRAADPRRCGDVGALAGQRIRRAGYGRMCDGLDFGQHLGAGLFNRAAPRHGIVGLRSGVTIWARQGSLDDRHGPPRLLPATADEVME
jgi:hypothetical protein